MKKLYILLLFSLIPSNLMYSMEHTVQEHPKEIEDIGTGLLTPGSLITSLITKNHSIEQAHSLLATLVKPGKAAGTGVEPYILKQIDLRVRNAISIERAYKNVEEYLKGLDQQGLGEGEKLRGNDSFIRHIVDTMYKRFAVSPKYLRKTDYEKYFDRIAALTISLNNNDYAVGRLKQWLKGIGDEQAQQKFLTSYMIDKIVEGARDKVVFLIETMGANVNTIFNKDGYTPLMFAAMKDNREIVEYLVDNGADIHATNKYGETPLVQALGRGHGDIAKYLIDKGANLNVRTGFGYTLLMLAVSHNLEDIARYLTEHGADVNAVNPFVNNTALILAAEKGNENIVKYLIKQDADVNAVDRDKYTALIRAAIKGHKTLVEYLVNNGADINVTTIFGKTARDIAQKYGYKEIVALLDHAAEKHLIANGAPATSSNVQATSKQGTPTTARDITVEDIENIIDILNRGLTINYYNEKGQEFDQVFSQAISCENKDHVINQLKKWLDDNIDKSKNIDKKTMQQIFLNGYMLDKIVDDSSNKVIFLIENMGANVNATARDGQTPLIVAIKKRNKDLVKYLVEHGAHINAADGDNTTVLMYAAAVGNKDIFEYLVEHGADLNAIDTNEDTVLLYAIQQSNKDVVKYLVDLGTNIHAANSNKTTVLMCAAAVGSKDIFEYLVDLGANINDTDVDKETVLMYATRTKNKAVVEYLVEHGANINATNKHGQTARDIAQEKGYHNIVVILDQAAAKQKKQ